MMEARDLARLSSLLDEALELDDEGRAAWLARLQGDDQALVPRLRRLLSEGAAREAAEQLERGPAFEPSAAEAPAAPGLVEGGRVGPYVLLRRLGEGGMGEVWLAERSDGQMNRRVALKLPVLGQRRALLVQRFARERDILGALAHPHIARLYDAGLADDGQPFLALEFVDGVPITDFVRAGRLDLRRRVTLLLQVMDAVQYAHANLVVHRDLKPSNVLVTAAGHSMLLDFGIAKLLQGEGLAFETELTQLGGRALTLEYAAPEQHRGEPISTATDVWALGVLLYELVADARPFAAATRGALETQVLEAMPEPPSRRGGQRVASRAAAQDLDTIALKALGKRPAERYATVEAFARDLRRWLDGAPIEARPDGLLRRAQRWLARHRVPVASVATVLAAFGLAFGFGATALVIAALLAGLAAALWQARAARRQAALARGQTEIARVEARTAQAVERFLESIFRSNSAGQRDPRRARQRTAKELLDEGAARIGSELVDAPEAKLRVLKLMGGLYEDIGELVPARQLAQTAVDLARRQFGEGHALHLSALVSLSRAATLSGRLDEAGQLARHAAALARQRDELPPGLRMEIELAHGAARYLKHEAGVLEQGERAVALARSLPDHPDSIDAIILYAMALLGERRLDEAQAAMNEALAAAERRGPAAGPQLNGIHLRMADVLEARRDIDGATRHLRLAIEAAMHYSGPSSMQVMASTVVLGRFLEARGRPLEALAEFDRARAVIESMPASERQPTLLATIDTLRACALLLGGRLAEAERVHDAVDVERGLVHRPDMLVLLQLLQIEIALWRGVGDELGPRFDAVEASIRAHDMLASPVLARLSLLRCEWLARAGQAPQAQRLWQHEAEARPGDPLVAATGAAVALAAGQPDVAANLAAAALGELEHDGRLQSDAPVVARLLQLQGLALQGQGRSAEALGPLQRALRLQQQQCDATQALPVAETLQALAAAEAALGDRAAAEGHQAEAAAIRGVNGIASPVV